MYNWNLKDLKNLLSEYKRKIKATDDLVLREEYEKTVSNIIEVIKSYRGMTGIDFSQISSIIPNTYDSVIRDDFNIHQICRAYFPIVRDFRDRMDGTEVSLQDNLPKVNISCSEIVAITSEFYHQFRGIFSSTFDDLAANFRNRLYFRKAYRNNCYGGNTYSIYGTNEVFVECIKGNTMQDCVSSIHESSHAITSRLNQNIMWDWNKYCLIEVDSLFFEMVGTSFVADLLGDKLSGLRIRLATFKDNLYSADIICSKEDMYGDLSNKELQSKKNVIDYYKEEIGYDKFATKDAMYSRIQDYMHYIISYLVAVELYMIFINDQNRALDLLYKIVMLKDLDNNIYLRCVRKLGIEPGRNIKEYYNLLLKEEDGIKYGKKLQYR